MGERDAGRWALNAATLFGDLAGAGIRLVLQGETLAADVLPGVDLDAFRGRIATNRPALLRKLTQRAIVQAAIEDPAHFDRERLNRLCQQWSALPDPEAEIATLTAQLEMGWRWLQDHPDHPENESFFGRWIGRLRAYERAYTAYHRIGDD